MDGSLDTIRGVVCSITTTNDRLQSAPLCLRTMFGAVYCDMFPGYTYGCSLSPSVERRNKPTNRLIESEQLHLPHWVASQTRKISVGEKKLHLGARAQALPHHASGGVSMSQMSKLVRVRAMVVIVFPFPSPLCTCSACLGFSSHDTAGIDYRVSAFIARRLTPKNY